MSDFEELPKPQPGEMPSLESLREMLEQHAYEAAKLFASQGGPLDGDLTKQVNYGTVNDVQLRVIFHGLEQIEGREEFDMHQVGVDWRTPQEGLADTDGWEDLSIPTNRVLLYDHTKSGITMSRGGTKTAQERKDTAPEEMKRYRFEDASPEGVAYLDNLLTQLVTN